MKHGHSYIWMSFSCVCLFMFFFFFYIPVTPKSLFFIYLQLHKFAINYKWKPVWIQYSLIRLVNIVFSSSKMRLIKIRWTVSAWSFFKKVVSQHTAWCWWDGAVEVMRFVRVDQLISEGQRSKRKWTPPLLLLSMLPLLTPQCKTGETTCAPVLGFEITHGVN